MIRLLTMGLIGLGLGAMTAAQEVRPGIRDLERELFGPQDNETATEQDALGALSDDEEADLEGQKRTYQKKDTVLLRALDKITGRSTDFEMIVGEPKVYGSLRIDLQTCFQTPPEEPPESAAFLQITTAATKQVQSMAAPRDLTEQELDAFEEAEADTRFSGWMFASSPGLNALEHPVYDIWVIACSAVDPSELTPLPPSE